ncbi:hypothetical protein VW29_11775 [Devosia limi DSM 17137]|uniref:STAS domain-containing protein n=1 Tax=Devosia limi DSM 17137 TaxID=1121477 RepID=A0A0F5LPA0_9HYPH|nr:STAS domain-containing protein [Devosia limi]KKB84165.1 hypothetical protein VW29_11775 [Devosia limi DSM 17137]SHE94455.1 hypothetical protein SAMN02745223_01501 [Devosia limi DSM 17137]
MEHSQSHLFELRGKLGLRDATEVASALSLALETHPAVTVAVAADADLDITILQVLVAAHKTAARAGKGLTLTASADSLLRQTLVKAGFVSPAGAAQTAEGQFWTHTSKGYAA